MQGFYTSVNRSMNFLLYRGYDENGQRVSKKVKFRPTLYLEAKDQNKPASDWKALDGTKLDSIQFDTMKECREFQEMYKDVPSFTLHGNDKHIPAFIQSQFPLKIQFDRSLVNVASLDIETAYDDGYSQADQAENEILTITVKYGRNMCISWGMKPYDVDRALCKRYTLEYRQFRSEREMLSDFILWWSQPDNTPDIITGWNIRLFDIPYLINRLSRVHGDASAKKLSPWNIIDAKEINLKGKQQTLYEIYGIQQLDYIDLFQKFAYTYGNQESYKLGHIANVVLDETKVELQDDEGRAISLNEMYDTDFQKFLDYNIRDVELVDRLDEKLGLITLVLTMAYLGGVNYNDTLGTTAIWDAIIFRRLALKKIAVPAPKHSHQRDFEGGYVKEPHCGMHEWVCSFDAASLYPNIIVQYNMSPETFVHHERVIGLSPEKILSTFQVDVPNSNLAVAANGSCYRKDIKGIIPEIVEELYDKRVAIKKEMLTHQKAKELVSKDNSAEIIRLERLIALTETEQTAIKILLNSLFGAQSNRFFRYFNMELAEGITLTGQLIIQLAEMVVNRVVGEACGDSTIDRVCAIDTDSTYVIMSDLIEKVKPQSPVDYIDGFARDKITPEFANAFKHLCKLTNAYTSRIVMKREAIADRAIWTGAKCYILNVLDSEGVRYTTPKIKMKGIAAVKSSTPMACRKELKKMFVVIMTGDKTRTQNEIAAFKSKFCQMSAEEVAFPRGVTNITDYAQAGSVPFSKGSPIHVRGSLLYNYRLKQLGIHKQFPLINNGEKIRFVYLKLPNPLGENVIAFPDKLPSELGLNPYIDYDLQFEKTFIDPMKIVMNKIGWPIEERGSLEEFFS